MPRTVRQCLLAALDDLGDEDFQRFKADLRESALPADSRPIPWGKLEKASRLDTAKLMVDFYRDSSAGGLAVQVLHNLNQVQTADSLQEQLGSAQSQPKAPVYPTGGHPIDDHHSRIVQGFSSVDGVLDALLSARVITVEHYDRVRGRSPRQEKVRELMTIVRGMGAGAKDRLWEAMVEADPYFTSSLASQ